MEGSQLKIVKTPQVCAYANNQHQLDSDIPADPKDSAFFKAMQLCEGVLVVLDPGAVVFTRIWCSFEQATVVQGKKLLLDFATVYDGTPQLLTEGLAHEKEALEMKATRERRFPLELMEKGYSLDITAADASRPEDKRHILNSIAKTDLEAEPDLTDPEFARVNAVLRSTLAEHAALKAAEAGRLGRHIHFFRGRPKNLCTTHRFFAEAGRPGRRIHLFFAAGRK